MRSILPLLLLCACSTLSPEDRDQLSLHQRNAKLYYDDGKIEQAVDQVERGLKIDPDDYLLRSLKGGILLRFSGSALGSDHQQLDEATAILADVYAERSASRHEPYLLLNYALALQKQGRRQLGQGISLRDQASRAPEPAPFLAAAERATTAGRNQLLESRRLLGVMVERGDMPRVGHYHLMLIAQDLGDGAAFASESKAYLEQLETDRRGFQRNLDMTAVPGYEQALMNNLRMLKLEELDVRSLLAENHYFQREYQEALVMLNRVLELDPARSVDYYNRGRTLLELGRANDAKADFRKFLATSNLPADSDKKTFALLALSK